jgi:purine-binding chemotaxis protein CheW
MSANRDMIEYVTVVIGGQLFGLPIERVQDVFMPDAMTRVPLSAQEIAGVLNLRGRIVTAIDMRRRLGLPPKAKDVAGPLYAVGVERAAEAYGLLIDSVGEVMSLSTASLEANPVNLDPRWVAISAGVHRLDGRLLVVLDVDRVLAFDEQQLAA